MPTKFITFFELTDYGVPRYSRKHLIDHAARREVPEGAATLPQSHRLGPARNRSVARVATDRQELPRPEAGDAPA